MPYPHEHAIRLHDPDGYVRFRRKTLATGVDAIIGFKEGGGSEVQALRFDADRFTPAEARAWAKDHDMSGSFEAATGKFAKVDAAERKVFGWANVSTQDGDLLVDLQDDTIAPAVLEKAAHDFALDSREANAMHEGPAVGTLIESVVLSPEKLRAMFSDLLDAETLEKVTKAVGVRWWTGFQLDASTFAKVQDGTYRGFSIEGTADREAAA